MPFNNHQFLPITQEDEENAPQLDGLTVAGLKMIYNALLMEVFSDGERPTCLHSPFLSLALSYCPG